MKTIPTAKEFLKNYLKNNPNCQYDEVMIEFAKFHVEACKKDIWKELQGGIDDDMEEVITDSYPLENIK